MELLGQHRPLVQQRFLGTLDGTNGQIGERGVPEYVVVGNNGTILWSNNAETWYSVTSGTTNNLQAIAYNGTRYVAVGAQGAVIYSDNVKTWNSGTSGTSVSLRDVIYNDDCDKFVAVGIGGKIVISSDGNTWTEQESGTNQELRSCSWSKVEWLLLARFYCHY